MPGAIDGGAPEQRLVMADELVREEHSGEKRPGGQDVKRPDHHRRAVMHPRQGFARGARLAMEGHEHQPPGIESGKEGGYEQQPEGEGSHRSVGGEGRLDDGVLGIVAGGKGKACQRQGAHQHEEPGLFQIGEQPAHAAHVLLVAHGVNDRTGAEEQQGLEEGVGEQVEHAHAIGPHAHGHEHVAKLRAGGIGDDALDVVLHQADGGGEEGGDAADEDDRVPGNGGQLVERRHARHQEDAGGDHGGGVNQRRDGGRAFHRIRQPGVQQELRRLAHRPHEEQQADDGENIALAAEEIEGLAGHGRGGGEDGVELDGAENGEDGEYAQGEAEIAHPVDHKGLDGRRIGRWFQIPEADQQIGGQTDALPAEEHLQQVVRRHQHEHGEGEQRQIGEKARLVGIVGHVAQRIDVDDGGDGGHHHQHDRRKRVDAQGPRRNQLARAHPLGHHHLVGVARRHVEKGIPGQQRGYDEDAHGQHHGPARPLISGVMMIPVFVLVMSGRRGRSGAGILENGRAEQPGGERADQRQENDYQKDRVH